jgi:plastocyanin
MKSTIAKIFVLLIAVMLVGAACSKKTPAPTAAGSQSPQSSESPQASESPEASPSSDENEGKKHITINGDRANNHGTKDISSETAIEVEADDFYFEPTILKGTAGQQVEITFGNETKKTLHNFSTSDGAIDQDLPAGKDTKVTVTFPQSGSLEFFCKYHKALGMVGELMVS